LPAAVAFSTVRALRRTATFCDVWYAHVSPFMGSLFRLDGSPFWQWCAPHLHLPHYLPAAGPSYRLRPHYLLAVIILRPYYSIRFTGRGYNCFGSLFSFADSAIPLCAVLITTLCRCSLYSNTSLENILTCLWLVLPIRPLTYDALLAVQRVRWPTAHAHSHCSTPAAYTTPTGRACLRRGLLFGAVAT